MVIKRQTATNIKAFYVTESSGNSRRTQCPEFTKEKNGGAES